MSPYNSVILVLLALPHKHRVCAVLFSRLRRKACCTLVFNLLYSVIFVCELCLTNIGFVSCFSFCSSKAGQLHAFVYALVRTLFCVFCLTNTGFVQCYSLGSRQVCCMLVFILLYSVIFCFACFASSTSDLCSAFPFGSPQVYTLLVFFVLFSLLLLCVLCPTSSSLCSDFSPAPLEFARFIFALYYSVLSLCSAFFPSLIYSSFHRFP